jgi:hypothetical protein
MDDKERFEKITIGVLGAMSGFEDFFKKLEKGKPFNIEADITSVCYMAVNWANGTLDLIPAEIRESVIERDKKMRAAIEEAYWKLRDKQGW